MEHPKSSAYQNAQIMPDNTTSLHAGTTVLPRPDMSTMSPKRLDAVCAVYNHLNPTYSLTDPSSSTTSCADKGHDQCFQPPDMEQLRDDLQLLLERLLALESEAADNTYRRISLQAMEMAGDEYIGFDWEKLKGIIGNEAKELIECGCHVDVSDLVTLRIRSACL